MTPYPDDQKSAAYLIYSEWGPQRSIPRAQRLAQEFPKIPEDTLAAWMEEFKRIEAEIWRIAEQGGPKTFSFEDFKKRMLRTFALMNEEALSRAWTLTGYYTWHEGY
jgi:hypothetical protein